MAKEKEKKKIIVMIKEPGKPVVEKEIEEGLESYQAEVRGDIESIPMPGEDTIDIIVNDMGKLTGMLKNLVVPEYGDILMGPIVFIGVDPTECAWCSLTKEEKMKVEAYVAINHCPYGIIEDSDGDRPTLTATMTEDDFYKIMEDKRKEETREKTIQKIMEWIHLHPGINEEIKEYLVKNGYRIEEI